MVKPCVQFLQSALPFYPMPCKRYSAFSSAISPITLKNQKNGIRSKRFMCLSFHYLMFLMVTHSKFIDRRS